MNLKLGKPYKLCSKKLIQQIFDEGNSLNSFPFSSKYVLLKKTEGPPFQVAFSVPKKKFKSAVDRNRIKRLMKETVRLNKAIIEDKIPEDKQLALFLIYTPREEFGFDVLNSKMIKLLNKITTLL
ncbi:MAG: ribonuclease P protein component [Crocinitomicaceae bacterium]